ncbi:MAG: glycosyltransferase family 2 protein [Candidatus Omnitrophota bacterium]
MNTNNNEILLSVVMPCLNEEETVGTCIKKAFSSIEKMGIKGEVVIADNGSTDRSISIAESLGARVVAESIKGYGKALIKGISESRGKYVLMGDADDSYDFSSIEGFVEKLKEGYDLVMGTRLKGEIKKGAMSLSHRLGNPVMTWILNIFYRTGISDVNCGLRAFTKKAFEKLDLKCGGMEFASEFVVKSIKEKLKIAEIPIILYKDGRSRPPHLRTIHDAWRHLRFLLIYCPTFLYMIPGLLLFTSGFFILTRGLFTPFQVGHFTIDFHFNFLGSVLSITGFQLCMLGLLARSFAYIKGFDKYDKFIINYVKTFSLERSLIIGILAIGFGLVFFMTILAKWIIGNFGELFEVRKGIIGITLIAIGFQYISSSFFLSMLLMEDVEKKQLD